MNRPPRKRGEPLLNKRTFILAFFWYGLILSVLGMFGYVFVNVMSGNTSIAQFAQDGLVYQQATTMTLAMIVFGQIGMVLNCRTENQSIFKIGILSNKKVLTGIVVEIILMALLMYVPVLQGIFNTAPLGYVEWIVLILTPIPAVLLDEMRKSYVRKKLIVSE